jgi:hypothetical protein|tara:strand:+ start:483 stop:794 length:312 start_codon:yes stop_codon:yes gene_type:complete
MVVGLSILSGVLFALLSMSIYYNIKVGTMVLSVQDSIEETLDILDERYESISKILEIPLYNDSPEIRRIHGDISHCRDAILFIANKLIAIDTANISVDEGDEE